MRALTYEGYGPAQVLAVREVTDPRPEPGEVLVRVRAAALNPKDVMLRKGRFRLLSGARFPKIVGLDFAGEGARLSCADPATGDGPTRLRRLAVGPACSPAVSVRVPG